MGGPSVSHRRPSMGIVVVKASLLACIISYSTEQRRGREVHLVPVEVLRHRNEKTWKMHSSGYSNGEVPSIPSLISLLAAASACPLRAIPLSSPFRHRLLLNYHAPVIVQGFGRYSRFINQEARMGPSLFLISVSPASWANTSAVVLNCSETGVGPDEGARGKSVDL